MTMRNRILETILALAAGLSGALFTGMLTLDFHAPLRPTGDYVFALFHIKTLLRFGVVHANPELGFPGSVHLEAFPLPDLIGHAITRLLAVFTEDPLTLLPMVLATFFVGLGASTYAALRASSQSRFLAFLGGFLFASSAHMADKAYIHPWLCVLFAVPWVCRLILLTPYQGARLAQKPFALSVIGALIVGLASGACGIYTAFFSAFYLAFALALFALLKTEKEKLKPLATALAGTLLSFGALALPLLVRVIQRGESFPNRNLFFQPLYGLRLPDVFVPQIPFLTSFYETFHQMQDQHSDEGNYQVLGLYGVLVLLFAFWVALRRTLPQKRFVIRREPMVRTGLVMILFGILFAVPYGLGFVFNQVINGVIRSQVRIGSFFLPFALLMAPALYDRLRAKMSPPVWRALMLGIALLTSLPLFLRDAHVQEQTASVWQARKASLEGTLAALDHEGLKRVAQYPSIYMPEGPFSARFGNIDYLWPYILDQRTDRKWSFGSMVFESNWARIAAAFRQPPDVWQAELGLMGFDSLLFEKEAMSDQEQQALQNLKSLKPGHIVYEDAARLLYRLHD